MISASRLSSSAMSNARRAIRRRYRRRRLASSNSLDAFSAVAELPPRGDDLRDPLGCLVTLSGACRHGGDEQRDHPRIEPIVFGQNATGLGELAKLERIDLP